MNMMKKMKFNGALGAHEQGRLEPVSMDVRTSSAGIGFDVERKENENKKPTPVASVGPQAKHKVSFRPLPPDVGLVKELRHNLRLLKAARQRQFNDLASKYAATLRRLSMMRLECEGIDRDEEVAEQQLHELVNFEQQVTALVKCESPSTSWREWIEELSLLRSLHFPLYKKFSVPLYVGSYCSRLLSAVDASDVMTPFDLLEFTLALRRIFLEDPRHRVVQMERETYVSVVMHGLSLFPSILSQLLASMDVPLADVARYYVAWRTQLLPPSVCDSPQFLSLWSRCVEGMEAAVQYRSGVSNSVPAVPALPSRNWDFLHDRHSVSGDTAASIHASKQREFSFREFVEQHLLDVGVQMHPLDRSGGLQTWSAGPFKISFKGFGLYRFDGGQWKPVTVKALVSQCAAAMEAQHTYV